MVPGVAQVNVFGAQKYAVRVKVNPDQLASHTSRNQRSRRRAAIWNVNLPVGTLWGPHKAMNIQATGQLWNADEFRPT